jgi:HEAT repeat protein
MRWLLALAAVTVLAAPSDRTVVTRDGKVHVGAVTREGTVVVVTTSTGAVRLPAVTVIADYASLPQAKRHCEARLEQAKKLFTEATGKAEEDPMRRRQLTVTLDICNETRDLLEILEKRASGSDRDAFATVKGTLSQFLRLVRDAKGATALADGASGHRAEKVPLESLGLAVEAIPEATGFPGITDDLGPGQLAAIPDLAAEDPAVRALAAVKLGSPPGPHAVAALSKALQSEKEKVALAALADTLVKTDIGAHLKTEFAWALEEDEAQRRTVVIFIAGFQQPAPACEFLAEMMKSKPPTDPKTRAAFASAFRRLRKSSVETLRETLKTKDSKLAIETVKQLGMLRDKGALSSLRLALGGTGELKAVAFNALEKSGPVAIPMVLELMGEKNDEIRKLALILAQRITEDEIDGPAELQKWFAKNRKTVEDREKEFWKEQEEKEFPVSPEEFRMFERKLPSTKDMRGEW